MKLINIITRKNKLYGIVANGGGVPNREQIYLGPAEYTGFMRDRPRDDIRIVRCIRAGDWWKILFRDYDARQTWLQANFRAEIYEADFSPVRRYMSDHPDIEVETDLRWMSFDIETDPRVSVERAVEGEARIVSIAMYSLDGTKHQWCLAEDSDQAELDLLNHFYDVCENLDLIIGWNSEEFDKLVIEARGKRLGLWTNRRFHWLDAMLMHKRMDVQGQDSGENKSAALDVVANVKLGFGKNDYETSEVWDDWKAGGERRARMLEYNMQDAKLVALILQKTGYLESFLSICETCRIFPNSHNLKPTPQIDGYLSTFALKREQRLPTRKENPTVALEELEGAYVMDPTVSVAENVHVADFASLYPSIMRTLNLCWTTKDSNGQICVPEVGVRFRDDIEGLFPAFLAEMAEVRDHWKKKRKQCVPGTPEYTYADRRQMPPKTLSNSGYGVLANTYSRYYDLDLAKSVTAMGRWLIKLVMAEARKWELTPIYGDTDSVMISGCTTERFAEFVKHCNEVVFPRELKAIGCSRNYVQLDFVETFSKIVFTAAKRYAGRFSRYAGAPISGYAIEIKGLEYRRGDQNRLARAMQEEAVHAILGGWSTIGDIQKWVEGWRHYIFNEHIDVDDIAVDKGVKQEYRTVNKNGRPMTPPAQARVAKVLRERGKRPFRVQYVITDASVSPMEVIPAEDYDGEFDRFYLWEAVYSPTERLLVAAYPDKCNWRRYRAKRPKKALEGQLNLL